MSEAPRPRKKKNPLEIPVIFVLGWTGTVGWGDEDYKIFLFWGSWGG